MELKDFCKGLEHELTGWKAKLFDMQRKIDTLPSADKQRMMANTEDLRIISAVFHLYVSSLMERERVPTIFPGLTIS